MAEDDIYGNKRQYERFMNNISSLTKPLPKTNRKLGVRKYYCKNPKNLRYFGKLHKLFESRDTSYVRRMRIFSNLLFVMHMTKKDLCDLEREDIDEIIAASHKVNHSVHSKSDFIRRVKFAWKQLFPERDVKGRIDETIIPYPVRHLSSKIDRSKQKLRNDRLSIEEYEKLVNYFSDNAMMQCYITLAFESFGRPQEICYCKIGDVELHENYAKIWVSSHGKEGTKFLQSIDSHPYLIKWYEQHPYKQNKEAHLFFSHRHWKKPLTPMCINKKIKYACKQLHIERSISAYSLKRNGITFSRLKGDSDVEIQHRAGWTSTKQLKTYDLSEQNDSFKKELAKRGLINEKHYKQFQPKTKECICGTTVGFAEKICRNCKRIMDKQTIHKEMKAEQEIKQVFTYALEHPEMNFIEIMNNFRKPVNVVGT